MAFPSLPLYHLDPPPNWAHQQPNQFQQHDPVVIPTQNPQLPPPPPPTTVGGGGGSTRPMADRARLAKISQPDQGALKCPRCESTNTKFCYYNNYSLSQPRHFCKTCRRYWTRGGALRNVPVGGGCRRKTRRSSNKTKSKSPKQSASASANDNSSSSFCPSHHPPHHLHYSSQLLLPPPPTNDVVSGGIIGNHIHNIINGGSSISMLSSSSNGFVLPSLPHHHQQFPTFFTNLELEAPPISMELLHDHDQFEPSRSSISSTLLYPALNGGISTTTTTPPPHDHTTIKMEQNILGRHYANSDNINAWNIIDNSIPTFITSSSTTHYLS